MDEKESTQKVAAPPSSIDGEGAEASVDLEELSRSKDRAPQEEVVESIDSTKKHDRSFSNGNDITWKLHKSRSLLNLFTLPIYLVQLEV